MRASADRVLNITDDPMDVFLLDKNLVGKGEALKPIMVHEIAHYIEQTGIAHPAVEEVDQQNAHLVLDGFDDLVRSMHSQEWAELLCMMARRMVEQRNVSYTTVRAFLEAAVPECDRPQWNGKQIKELQ